MTFGDVFKATPNNLSQEEQYKQTTKQITSKQSVVCFVPFFRRDSLICFLDFKNYCFSLYTGV